MFLVSNKHVKLRQELLDRNFIETNKSYKISYLIPQAQSYECYGFLKHASSAGNYMFKVFIRNTRSKCEIYSKLKIKTPERRKFASFWCYYY